MPKSTAVEKIIDEVTHPSSLTSPVSPRIKKGVNSGIDDKVIDVLYDRI